MGITIINWSDRFSEQLKWTKELREYLYKKISLGLGKKKILEIGCGTGELLKEIGKKFKQELYGVDIDEERLKTAKANLKQQGIKAELKHVDFLNNNFNDQFFEVIITNYLFLWIKNLKKCFDEIYRILKEDGVLLILSEPDYGGFIEYPDSNLKEGLLFNLKKAGADPEVGRKLNQYFSQNFKVEECFCTSIPWISNVNKEELLKEIDFFSKILHDQDFNSKIMESSIKKNKYFLFMPVFSYYLRKK